MRSRIAFALCVIASLFASVTAQAQGSIPVALQQISDQNGHPYVGALLYFFQTGTVATRQDSFQDTALSQANQWPLPTDAFGRVPMFYLQSGTIHVRLTDPNGLVIFEYPNMLVIGPSGGGGGGGGSVDPTTIAATGDMKFRLTSESLTGWVKLNALTVGSATSGASGRANADTQSLYIYLWNNCTNAHCPVNTGRGGSGLADFNANKALQVPDCRGRNCMVGLDDMGNSGAGRIANSNITSGGGDNISTPLATGGEANHTHQLAELPTFTPSGTVTINSIVSQVRTTSVGATGAVFLYSDATNATGTTSTGFVSASTTFAGNPIGSAQSFNVMAPFALGTYYMKL